MYLIFMGFPGGSDSLRICLQCRRHGFDPWVGKILWKRGWQPTPVFSLGEVPGQRSLVWYSPWGHNIYLYLIFKSFELIATSLQTWPLLSGSFDH